MAVLGRGVVVVRTDSFTERNAQIKSAVIIILSRLYIKMYACIHKKLLSSTLRVRKPKKITKALIHARVSNCQFHGTSRFLFSLSRVPAEAFSESNMSVQFFGQAITRSSATAEIARVGDHYAIQGHSSH